MTDGNNEPAVPDPLDPEQAAILARDLGVTLHTIAIGHRGGVVQGVDPDTGAPVMAEVTGPNLPLLERLAELTGGRSFVATDADALAKVFDAIDTLEKSPIRGQILTRYDEHYASWAGLAIALLSARPSPITRTTPTTAVSNAARTSADSCKGGP